MEIKQTIIDITPHKMGSNEVLEEYYPEEINDEMICKIIKNKNIDTIQINQPISNELICKINQVFLKRPDIMFRIYGGYGEEFNGWNLNFLRGLLAIERLTINCFTYKQTDLSSLKNMKNLRYLNMDVYDLKDYSFINDVSDNIQELSITADVNFGKALFDCKWLLRFKKLNTLHLAKIDTNLKSITKLKKLRKLKLRSIKTSNLAFLKELPITDLSIMWCAKQSLPALKNFSTLRRLELFRIAKLDDISFINTLSNLETLKLVWLSNITRLPDVSNLKRLKTIEIDTMTNLNDISSLVDAQNLQTLKMVCVKSMTKEAVSKVLSNESIQALRCWLGGKKKEQAQINEMLLSLKKINTIKDI